MNNSNKTLSKDSLELKKPVDAAAEVFITKDILKAYISILPPENGGEECNFLSIRKTLSDNNITSGIDMKVLLETCQNPQYNTKILIAEGNPPIHGVDGSFDIKFKTSKDLKPKIKEDGTVDFYNLENIVNVKKGDLLCTIVPPTKGTAGESVSGKIINAINGKPVPNLSGKNTNLSEDGRSITSHIDGQVDYIQGRINVNETFNIRGDVDGSTGNIKVVGNVVISGAVRSGFVVEATGNIQVQGSLGSVTLISGGDILLRGGIIGGNITCESNLTSKFIENCKVLVKGDIKTDYIMNSHIRCGKNIEAINSISKIVGGRCFAGENISAKVIGSPANVKTYLNIGPDPNALKKQISLKENITVLETQIKSLKSLIKLLQQFKDNNQLSLDKKRSLEDAIYSSNEINRSIETLKLELQEITDEIQSIDYGRVSCKGILYAGTTVKILKHSKQFSNSLFSKSIYYTKDGLGVSDL
nr:FapA family protein [Tissierella sp.]